MSWFYLITAILLEVAGTTSMKLSKGMTRPVPTILMFVLYFACFGVFSLAIKKMDMGVAYAVWSAVGTSLIAAIGILFFKDSLNWLKAASILLIIIGVVGLNLSGIKH
jgi:small multidrug resistance pump